jgi:RsiW-degrading membrane proteinase PrsW (M82 family)
VSLELNRSLGQKVGDMQLTLFVESGRSASHQFKFEGGSATIGRGPSCQIRFDDTEREMSRQHATLEGTPDACRLTDRSTNGTFINGQRATTAVLKDGDVVQFGSNGPRLRVRLAEAGAQVSATKPAHKAPATLADQSLYDPRRDRGVRRQSLLGVILILLMTIIGIGLGTLMMAISFFELGLVPAIAGVVVAFVPAPIYLMIWLWLDRYDPEPAWALAGCLAWGAGAATFVAGIVNSIFAAVMVQATQNQMLGQFLAASISAPVIEELGKGLAVLLLMLFLRREFDGILDGIVYAGVVALGFATVENVLYYGRGTLKGGVVGLAFVFSLRGILGPFCHSVFTAMTGIGCGWARQSHNWAVRILAPPAGLAGAIFLHFLWNTLAGLSGSVKYFLIIYLVIWLPLFVVFFIFVIWMGHRESKLIRRMLELEVARGLLTKEQVAMVGSWIKRITWQLSVGMSLGRLMARHRFIHAASRLALCYWHADQAAAAGGVTVSFDQIPSFRKEIQGLLKEI